MNGLNADPGCRCACVTWLNLLRSKSKPPTSDRIAPSLRPQRDERGLRPAASGRSPSAPCRRARRGSPPRVGCAGRGRRLVAQSRAANLRPSPVISSDFAIGQHGLDLGGAWPRARRRDRARRSSPRFLRTRAPALLALGGIVGQADVGLRPAVAVPAVVIDDAAAHCSIGGFLVGLADRRLDGEALGVGVLAIGVEHDLPRHFRDVLRVRRQRFAHPCADGQWRGSVLRGTVSSVMNRRSCIRRSTYSCRVLARFGLVTGL